MSYRHRIHLFPRSSHIWNEGTVTAAATCTADGVLTKECSSCGATTTESIPATGHTPGAAATCTTAQTCTVCGAELAAATGEHSYGEWKVTKAATVLKKGKQVRTCTVCGAAQTEAISKLEATITLTADSLKMKTGQSTTAFKVTGMTEGDYLKSVKSGNTKILKVSKIKKNGTFKLTAQKKTGTAKLTVTLASGKKKTIKVTVQKAKVTTTKISITSKKVTLKKGKTLNLAKTLVITPVTSQDKVTYTSSNKKVVTVTSAGKVKAVKKGTATITIKSGKKKVKCKITVK